MSRVFPTVAFNESAVHIVPFFSQTKGRRPTITPLPKAGFFGKSGPRRSESRHTKAWKPEAMEKSNKDSVSTDSRGPLGGQDVGFFEQESFIDGSSEDHQNSTPAGLEAILNHLSKWLVTAIFCAVVVLRHDAESMWAALGSIFNGGLSVALKQILNQERPSSVRSDPGMPSSHAQSIFFTVVFSIFSMVEWLGVNGFTTSIGALAVALGSYFSWLRVSLQFHTVSQVIVGAIVGSMFSIFWFWLWGAVISQAFISYLWVRVTVVLGAGGFCVAFILYVIRNWVMEETVDLLRRAIKL